MKRIFMIAAAVDGLWAAASCQKEGVPASSEVKVSFTVALPDALQTKAIAQAEQRCMYFSTLYTGTITEIRSIAFLPYLMS